MELTGRHVLITGASRGIGAGLAAAFATAGAHCTLVARSEGPLREVAERTGAAALPADLTDPEATADLIGRAEAVGGPLDVLVNNAGVDLVGRFADTDPGDLRRLWELNVVAGADLARRVLPGMLERRQGRLVFVSSLSAEVALPGLTAYSATKAATSMLADGLRAELAGTGVGTTLVELGPVDTDMWDGIHAQPATGAAFDRAIRLGFLRRLSVEEVATAVVAAVGADRANVVLPRRGWGQWAMARGPQRLADTVFRR